MKQKLVSLSIALAFLLLSVGTASAFPLYYSGTPGVAGTQFEDNNLDYFIDNDGDGMIGVGDVLKAALEFEEVLDLVGGAPAYSLDKASDELVAWSTIKLDSFSTTATGATAWNFVQDGATPMIEVYSGGATDLLLGTAGSDPSLADAEAAVKDGTHLWDFSITADPDTYWTFVPLIGGAADPSIVKSQVSTFKIGVANYQLNQVWGNDIFDPISGLTLPGGDGMVDLIGSADLLGGQGLRAGADENGSPYAFSRSDADAAVNVIPEPATMTLFGIGLLSLAAISRRRKA